MDEHVSAQCLIGKCGVCPDPECQHRCHRAARSTSAGETVIRAAELARTIGVAVVVGVVVLAVALPVATLASVLGAVVLARRPEHVVLVWDET